MPVPYRKSPKSTSPPAAAYLEVFWLKATRTFYGAILIIDASGQPLEFVYNSLQAPGGVLWPEQQVRDLGVSALCHSLFEACERDPELLVCRSTLGSAEYCRSEIAPVVPFAQLAESVEGSPISWSWINDQPTPGMPAYSLGETLRAKGLTLEPFNRIYEGVKEVWPEAPWEV